MISKLVRLLPYDPPLAKHAADVTSQYGEDGIIAHIMRVIEPAAKRFCAAWVLIPFAVTILLTI